MGFEEYEPIAAKYHVPDRRDRLRAARYSARRLMCVQQLEEGRAEVENQYARAVRREGNVPAQQTHARGVRGRAAQMARRRRDPAERPRAARTVSRVRRGARFGVADRVIDEPAECISGLVLQGLRKPHECPAFGTRCTPEHPLGATMVSSEGACAAYYRYRRTAACGRDRHVRRSQARSMLGPVCPIPISQYPQVLLAHGGGGQLMHQLIEQMFVPAFANPPLGARTTGRASEQGVRSWPSRPIPTSCGRCSFPAATSARWR